MRRGRLLCPIIWLSLFQRATISVSEKVLDYKAGGHGAEAKDRGNSVATKLGGARDLENALTSRITEMLYELGPRFS